MTDMASGPSTMVRIRLDFSLAVKSTTATGIGPSETWAGAGETPASATQSTDRSTAATRRSRTVMAVPPSLFVEAPSEKV